MVYVPPVGTWHGHGAQSRWFDFSIFHVAEIWEIRGVCVCGICRDHVYTHNYIYIYVHLFFYLFICSALYCTFVSKHIFTFDYSYICKCSWMDLQTNDIFCNMFDQVQAIQRPKSQSNLPTKKKVFQRQFSSHGLISESFSFGRSLSFRLWDPLRRIFSWCV